MVLGVGAAVVAVASPLGGTARADALFRPVTADPRECLAHWRMVSYTEDWRYGTDITDSTSQGGVERNRRGIEWEVAAAHTFRWKPLRRQLGFSPPWTAYQLAVPAGVFAKFDNSGQLLNADYQFGLSLDVQWNGVIATPAPEEAPVAEHAFDHPVITSRLMAFHRSSHLGDEYLALSRIGRNQIGNPSAGALFDHPPVKRMDLTYEALEGVVSVEWSPAWNARRDVMRTYAGFEARPLLPVAWRIGALRPAGFTSPAVRLGAEFRTGGNVADPHDGWVTRLVNHVARGRLVESGWFGAVDVRLAKPFNFASGDNPDGESEVWTPRLWTSAPYGREFRHYAGSWHAMLGAAVWPRDERPARTPLARREWLVSIDWYRGYSPDGQFLDQRLRWHSRWYAVPSVTARF
jgi:hypothetical protein